MALAAIEGDRERAIVPYRLILSQASPSHDRTHPLGNCLSTWGAEREARSFKAGPLFERPADSCRRNI